MKTNTPKPGALQVQQPQAKSANPLAMLQKKAQQTNPFRHVGQNQSRFNPLQLLTTQLPAKAGGVMSGKVVQKFAVHLRTNAVAPPEAQVNDVYFDGRPPDVSMEGGSKDGAKRHVISMALEYDQIKKRYINKTIQEVADELHCAADSSAVENAIMAALIAKRRYTFQGGKQVNEKLNNASVSALAKMKKLRAKYPDVNNMPSGELEQYKSSVRTAYMTSYDSPPASVRNKNKEVLNQAKQEHRTMFKEIYDVDEVLLPDAAIFDQQSGDDYAGKLHGDTEAVKAGAAGKGSMFTSFDLDTGNSTGTTGKRKTSGTAPPRKKQANSTNVSIVNSGPRPYQPLPPLIGGNNYSGTFHSQDNSLTTSSSFPLPSSGGPMSVPHGISFSALNNTGGNPFSPDFNSSAMYYPQNTHSGSVNSVRVPSYQPSPLMGNTGSNINSLSFHSVASTPPYSGNPTYQTPPQGTGPVLPPPTLLPLPQGTPQTGGYPPTQGGAYNPGPWNNQYGGY